MTVVNTLYFEIQKVFTTAECDKKGGLPCLFLLAVPMNICKHEYMSMQAQVIVGVTSRDTLYCNGRKFLKKTWKLTHVCVCITH